MLQDDKKLIRYREGKIVSTKGERFSQVTKEESQEMKKSIVNITLFIWQLFNYQTILLRLKHIKS